MSGKRYKSKKEIGLFAQADQLKELSELGDPLEKLSKAIDFEMFREELELSMLNGDKQSNAGCKPYDVVLMFKIIILKRYNNLSDEQAEFQIKNQLTFQRFLGISIGDRVPDARTIWLFQDKLIKRGLEERLFSKFQRYLDCKGCYYNAGQIVDSSFGEVRRPRNTKSENEQIKSGNGDRLWENNPYKKRQKDIEARFSVKRGQVYYGYKDHINIDKKSKLIHSYAVTSASVHDSQVLEKLVSNQGQELYGDGAYVGATIEKLLRDKDITSQIIERSYRGSPLTLEQRENNRRKSKIRCRVEHVFGFISTNMKGLKLRCIGYSRAKGVIGLINLVYNMCRYEQIERLNLLGVK